MPLGEFFSCVWLVLLALYFMTTFPRCFYCSSYSTTTYLSSPSSSHSSLSQSSQPEQNSATAAISAHTPCHHKIITSELISADCQQVLQKQQEPRMRITGEISEGPGPPSCPASCSDGRSESKKTFCHRYLKEKDCDDSWSNDWSSIRLRHCCEHSVREAVPNADESLKDRQQCERHVRDLLELDAFVAKVTCQFEQILLRYDCYQNYSVNNCQKCQDAYRRWVCASLIPHWRERHKIKPCKSICHAVEQNCPWFLPADKTPGYPAQYAGEPIFQCIDENIPETGEQLLRSTYGSGCCYEYCEKRRAIKSPPTGYHENQRNYYEIGSCNKGCDDSSSDPSHEAKSGMPLCQTPSTTSTTTSIPEKSSNRPSIPFVNFPLSSCPSSDTSSSTSNDASESTQNYSTTNAPFNLLILILILCLYVTNAKIDDWR